MRDEILLVKAQVERTYTYLFAIVGAILASQVLAKSVEHQLNRVAWLYLVAGLVSLWFPVNNILMTVDITTCATYVREVIAPKINNLAQLALSKEAPLRDQAAILELLGFAENVALNLPPEKRLRVALPMAWEEYTALFRVARLSQKVIFIPLFVARAGILYAPTVALVALYFAKAQRYTAVGIAFAAATAILVLLCLGSFFSVANLVSFGARAGAFKTEGSA